MMDALDTPAWPGIGSDVTDHAAVDEAVAAGLKRLGGERG